MAIRTSKQPVRYLPCVIYTNYNINRTNQITGDLTIRNVTKPVIFDVQAQATSDNQLTGSASTTIQRSDFNLEIPSVPFVANVGEQVTLEIDFVANSVGSQ